MSKASEWLSIVKERPEYSPQSSVDMVVNDEGVLEIRTIPRRMSQEDALSLGYWLIDTFGEGE